MADYLSKLFGLKGKVAVFIGGGGYLLSEMAREFSRCGVNIVIVDKNEAGLSSVVRTINRQGGRVVGFYADVTQKTELEGVRQDALNKFGRIDILVNGAGINAPTTYFDISLNEWHAILDSHITATFLACQVFGKHMVKKRKGSIINMSSVSAGPPLSKAFSYSVAKAGVRNLTQNLAREWAPFQVRVNALRPGFFPTAWSMKNFIDSKRKKAILGHTPMKRFGKPSELVGAALWLSSQAASFVTGAEITVDGGFTSVTI